MPIINQIVKGSGGGSAPAHYIEKTVDASGVMKNKAYQIDFSGVSDLGDNCLRCVFDGTTPSGTFSFSPITKVSGANACNAMCYYNNGFTTIDMSTIQEVSGTSAFSGTFQNNSSITTIDVSGLKKITGSYAFNSCFERCTGLTTVVFDSLEEITLTNGLGSTFKQCTSLISLRFPSLWKLTGSAGNMCDGCNALQTMAFESLSAVNASGILNTAFASCSNLQTIWFYALTTSSFGTYTNQFGNMLRYCSNVTVHFPMAIQSTIGSWADVTNGFGGTNTTVLFDIVTSLTGADTNTYTRSEKDSTATATAWKYNDVLYYTSGVSNNTAGVNEPTVGGTIYSDSACTTAVTTISAIA